MKGSTYYQLYHEDGTPYEVVPVQLIVYTCIGLHYTIDELHNVLNGTESFVYRNRIVTAQGGEA